MDKTPIVRKTAYGMKAFAPVAETARAPRSAGASHVVGVLVTIGIHVMIFGGVYFMHLADTDLIKRRAQEEPVQAIEAGLAIKQKAAAKKAPLPSKEVTEKVKPPDAPTISKNAEAVPDEKPKKKPDYVPKEAQDKKSVFDRYRNLDTGSLTSKTPGHTDSNQVGAEDGSEFGLLERAKGDPYVGELIGRMSVDFVVPTVVTAKVAAWGCVKLDDSGKIAERLVDPQHKSRSAAFNSAVEERLRRTSDMDKPVPTHLKELLVRQGACVIFKNE
jgi:hypothetical protein